MPILVPTPSTGRFSVVPTANLSRLCLHPATKSFPVLLKATVFLTFQAAAILGFSRRGRPIRGPGTARSNRNPSFSIPVC